MPQHVRFSLTSVSNGISIAAVVANYKARLCKSCTRRFIPKTRWQRYCSKGCQNREGQRRLRERARKATEEAMV